MALTIEVNQRHVLNAEEKLALLMLPRRKWIWILKTLGRKERRKAQKRIRQQKNIDGTPFAPRKRKKQTEMMEQMMLERMAEGLEPYVFHGTDLQLKHKNRLKGRIAARHHIGQSQKMTAAKVRKKNGVPDYDEPCTRDQAIALRQLGYKVRRKNGKGWKNTTLRYLMATMTMGQAGIIIRTMRGEKSKQSWDIPLPERQFLGSDEREVNRELIRLLEQARKRN